MIFAVVALAASVAAARSRPTCAGVRATQVSHRGHIVVKPRAVVVATGRRDQRINAAHGDRTRHIICAGPGNDVIEGGHGGNDILVGGPGNDTIKGHRGNNLLVGDRYNPHGNAVTRRGGRDDLYGSLGADVMIGDSIGSGDARGGGSDRILGKDGNDTIVGDSAATSCGTASGGGDDKIYGDLGEELEVGDSLSLCGTATGGGDDLLNHAVGSNLMVGDSATSTGTAIGDGDDALHGATGGDFHDSCGGCENRLYGDSYALAAEGSYGAGTGNDLLTSGLGEDTYLDGGGSSPKAGGRDQDICAGNTTGNNVGLRCGFYKDVQTVLQDPEPPPTTTELRRYGAWWPFRSASPKP